MEAVVVMVDVAGCFLGRRSSFFVCFGAYSEKIMCMAFLPSALGDLWWSFAVFRRLLSWLSFTVDLRCSHHLVLRGINQTEY